MKCAISSFFTNNIPSPHTLKKYCGYSPVLVACTALPVIGYFIERREMDYLQSTLTLEAPKRLMTEIKDGKLYTTNLFLTMGTIRRLLCVAGLICTIVFSRFTLFAKFVLALAARSHLLSIHKYQTQIISNEQIREEIRS